MKPVSAGVAIGLGLALVIYLVGHGTVDPAPVYASGAAAVGSTPIPAAPPPGPRHFALPQVAAPEPTFAPEPARAPEPILAPLPVAPPAAAGTWTPDGSSVWGPPAAPLVDPRRFTEVHWQGIEVVPRTPALARALGLAPELRGVIIDDSTLPADLQGFQAGDVVTSVGQIPTPDLMSFLGAAERVRDRRRVNLDLVRDEAPLQLVLTALLTRLGDANGETPSMIPPGARMPHAYRGPCTDCHRIGTTGSLPIDQDQLRLRTAPTINPSARRPHRDRGPCVACHRITP